MVLKSSVALVSLSSASSCAVVREVRGRGQGSVWWLGDAGRCEESVHGRDMAGLVSTSRCPAARGEGAVSGQNISGVVGLSAMAARRCDDDAEKRAVEVEDVRTEIGCTMALPNSSSIQLVASMASIAVTATNASGDFTAPAPGR